MIVLGTVLALAFFVLVGWLISTEMFQQRGWRKRVASGDHEIVRALIHEAMTTWRASRPPRDVPVSVWAGVRRVDLAAATAEFAVIQTSAEDEFRSVEGRREQVASALDAAFPLAARLVEMMLYDVPNLSLGSVRVDVYTTFTAASGAAQQKPILTTTAYRADADDLDWDMLAPDEILSRFDTTWQTDSSGLALPITLPPLPVSPDADPDQLQQVS